MTATDNKKSIIEKVMDFLLKYGILIGVIIVVFPWLKKYTMNMTASNEETEKELEKDREFQENKAPEVKLSKLEQITSRTDIHAAAESLAHDLGTKYSDSGSWTDWFDYSGWTENDEAAANTLIYQNKNYKLVERCYYVVTRSRNLTADVLKYLDGDELARVRKYINI